MKTYNVKLQFINSTEHDFWLALLKEEQQAFNLASTIVFNKKPVIALKQVYDITYREIRNVSVLLPAQGANKIIKSIISCFRSIKSNKHKLETAPMKKNLSLRLDKRLYSRFNKNTISLPSSIAQKRTDVKLILYPAVEKLFDNYTTAGNEVLRVYQAFGTTTSNIGWKLLRTDRISGWEPTGFRFSEKALDSDPSIPSRNQSGDNSMATVYKVARFNNNDNTPINTQVNKIQTTQTNKPINKPEPKINNTTVEPKQTVSTKQTTEPKISNTKVNNEPNNKKPFTGTKPSRYEY